MADSPSEPPLDPATQYEVTRRAVEDALWNVIGTAVYALFLTVLVVVGAQFLVTGAADATLDAPASLLAVAFGLVVVVAAGLELARTFEVFPF